MPGERGDLDHSNRGRGLHFDSFLTRYISIQCESGDSHAERPGTSQEKEEALDNGFCEPPPAQDFLEFGGGLLSQSVQIREFPQIPNPCGPETLETLRRLPAP